MIYLTIALIALTLFAFRELLLGYPPVGFQAAVLNRKEQAILRASAEAFFPEGGTLPSAEQADVVRYVDNMLSELPFRQRFLIRLLFMFVEHGSLIFGPNRARITRQGFEQRIETFRHWESSSMYFRRITFLSLRTLMTLAYFGDPAVNKELCHAA